MNVAHGLISTWEKIGVKYAFGIPGEETLDTMEALRKSKIVFVATRHESAAGFMAATVGRLTGVPALCVTTLGPGATNALTSLAYAKLGQMPMILLSGQKPIRSMKQGAFQRVDLIALSRGLTHLSQSIVSDAAAPSTAMEAYHLAQIGRGPVHIELAEDIAQEELPSSTLSLAYPSSHAAGVDAKALAEAVAMINNSNAPLLLFGQQANKKEVSQVLTRFVKSTGIPFLTTQLGKGAVDEYRKEYIGTPAVTSDDIIHEAIRQSDLLIIVGHNHAEKPPFISCCGLKKILHIDGKPSLFNEIYTPSAELVGDIVDIFDQLRKEVKQLPKRSASCFQLVKNQFKKHEVELAQSKGNTPYKIVCAVAEGMKKGGVLLLDNGMYKIWFARHYRVSTAETFLLDNALATMGAGLPSAIATALLYPHKSILAICGDGGFMMSVAELETAVRLAINLVVLLLCDSAYGMIEWKQKGRGWKSYGVQFQNPDFVTLAHSFGAFGRYVPHTKELADAIADAHQQGGVHLIVHPIDYQENEILAHLKELAKKM